VTSVFDKQYWHSMEIGDVLHILNSRNRGLTTEEAQSRLREFGPNELRVEKKISPLTILLRQFKSFLVIILLIATVISLALGEIIDAVAVMVIVVISAGLGFTQEYRSGKALEALRNMLSPTASVVRDGQEKDVPANEIVPGDVFVLRAGDKVPADARLIETVRLQINEASLTGESTPVDKTVSVAPENSSLGDRLNMVFSGTEVTYGKGMAAVVSTGTNTEFGKIAKQVTAITIEKTPLERRMEELGKWMGYLCLTVVSAVIAIGILRKFLAEGTVGMGFALEMLLFGVALAVAAVPEALPAIVTGSLAVGMRRMAKKNALVRKMAAVETLGCTTVICSDKTGTLTKGEMTVRQIFTQGDFINVTGVGYEPKGELQPANNTTLTNKGFSNLIEACILCNDADLVMREGKWHVKGDPTEGALIVVAAKAGAKQDELRRQSPRIYELPFSSERKRMTTVHSTSDSRASAYVKGAPEVIVDRCTYFHGPKGIEKLAEEQRKRILESSMKMANDALRVLAIATKELEGNQVHDESCLEKDLVFLGLVGMIDPPREEAIEAVQACKRVKIKPVMITGDHKLTAIAVAGELRIYQEGDIALTGEELEKMSQVELEQIVEKVTVYARVSPEHKLKIVQAWKSRGHVVAMTGDGVNDAPALKHADIGIAMGITGTEVSKEASSMVLTDDNFATIVNAIEMGRWIYDNIKKYLTYLLQANLVEIIVLSSIILSGYPLALMPAAILYINLATDGLPAIALGIGPPDPDIMKRPPRHPNETVFTKDVKVFLLRAVLIEAPLILWVYLWSLPQGIEFARTNVFITFILFELILALCCRSLKYTLLEVKPHKFLIIAVIWEIVLVLSLISVPAVLDAFGITYPGLKTFGLAIGLSLTTLFSVETLKYLLRNNFRLRRNSLPIIPVSEPDSSKNALPVS
jgi:Ca2+-transporting ATPase